MANMYKDQEGHWTTKENDGGPCYHKVGRRNNKYQAVGTKGEREDIDKDTYKMFKANGVEDEPFDADEDDLNVGDTVFFDKDEKGKSRTGRIIEERDDGYVIESDGKRYFQSAEQLSKSKSNFESGDVKKLSHDKLNKISNGDPDFKRWASDKYGIDFINHGDHEDLEVKGENVEKFFEDFGLNDTEKSGKRAPLGDKEIGEWEKALGRKLSDEEKAIMREGLGEEDFNEPNPMDEFSGPDREGPSYAQLEKADTRDNLLNKHRESSDNFNMPKEEGWEESEFGEKSFIKNKDTDHEMFIQYNGTDYYGNPEYVSGYMKDGQYVDKKFNNLNSAKAFLEKAKTENDTKNANKEYSYEDIRNMVKNRDQIPEGKFEYNPQTNKFTLVPNKKQERQEESQRKGLVKDTLLDKFDDAHLYNDGGKFQLALSNGKTEEFDTYNDAIDRLSEYSKKDYSWAKKNNEQENDDITEKFKQFNNHWDKFMNSNGSDQDHKEFYDKMVKTFGSPEEAFAKLAEKFRGQFK